MSVYESLGLNQQQRRHWDLFEGKSQARPDLLAQTSSSCGLIICVLRSPLEVLGGI